MYHILNGDALTDRFKATGIPGEIIICREALIVGPLDGETSADFFNTRANYFAGSAESEGDYLEWVMPEFKKIIRIPDGAEVNLWFGYDLFCRANMWYILSLLFKKVNVKVFAVHPSHLPAADRWKDFGGASPSDLQTCFSQRIPFSHADIAFGAACWDACKTTDFVLLEKLAATGPDTFPYLQEVCQAQIDRFPANGLPGRPEQVIAEIMEQTNTHDFHTILLEFWKREGIYGFGDVQVKQVYDQVMAARQ